MGVMNEIFSGLIILGMPPKTKEEIDAKFGSVFCSTLANNLIMRFGLFEEFGMSEEQVGARFRLNGYLCKQVLESQEKGFDTLGRSMDADNLRTTSGMVQEEIDKSISTDTLGPEDIVRERNVEFAIRYFFFLAGGGQSLRPGIETNFDMPPERAGLFRHQLEVLGLRNPINQDTARIL